MAKKIVFNEERDISTEKTVLIMGLKTSNGSIMGAALFALMSRMVFDEEAMIWLTPEEGYKWMKDQLENTNEPLKLINKMLKQLRESKG